MLANIIKVLTRYGNVFVTGLWNTLWLAAVSIILGSILGIFIALGKMSKSKVLNAIFAIYVEVIRGTPALLQLYIFWLGLPYIFPNISDTMSVMIALVVNASAYIAECIRAGIQAVDPGQREAAMSLGMTEAAIMKSVIFPQAVKNILPALGNEFIVMIKETSLASTFFVGELMTSFKIVQSNIYLALEPLIIIGLIYFAVTLILTRAIKLLERKLNADD